jgi:hypothetical protein
MTTRFRPACVRAARRFGAAARTAACVALSALALPFAAAAQADPRLDELYMLQPHNSYEHGAQLTLWLDAGYRTLELDVQDQEDWWANPRGPYVAHDGGPFNSNCRGTADRLADCLDDIVAWQDAHPGELPIVVFIDMKTRLANALSAWDWWKIDALDSFVSSRLGARQYRYSDLRAATAGAPGATPREKLRAAGWPTANSLRGRIVVAFTGGRYGAVNQGMADMIAIRGNATAAFLCPDVDAGDPDEISGTVDGMSAAASAQMFCANVQAGDHYQRVANRAAQYRQLMHLWGAAGDFVSTDYAPTYIAVAHGVSAIGMDVTDTLSDPNVFVPTWAANIPLVGSRRGLPGYFTLRPLSASGTRCVGTRNNGYGNGAQLDQELCSGGFDQQYVYTAEGQLRPRGNNVQCMDISGGSAGSGKAMHLWDCDGGDSEKWFITTDGRFRSRHNVNFCATVPNGTLSTGVQLRTEWCGSASWQQFERVAVPDWAQTNF